MPFSWVRCERDFRFGRQLEFARAVDGGLSETVGWRFESALAFGRE